MCGILATRFEHSAPQILAQRGADGMRTVSRAGFWVSHALHAIVGEEHQPFEDAGVFAANCEVYNWRELAVAHGVKARNDAHLLFMLLEQLPDDAFAVGARDTHVVDPRLSSLLASLRGSYAFVYAREGFLVAVRDPLGIRPLVYADDAIASSHAALEAVERSGIELHPRRMLRWDGSGVGFAYLPISFPLASEDFEGALERSVLERLPEQDVYVLLSGGVDSSLIAALASEHRTVTAVTVGVGEAPDVLAARDVARQLGIGLVEVDVDPVQVREATRVIARAIGEPHALKVSSALAPYFAAREVAKRGGKVLLSGFGADEVFVSYARSKLNHGRLAESWAHLLMLWESNAFKEDAASMLSTVEVRYPYLDFGVIAAAWRDLGDGSKRPIRDALERRGVDSDRPKKASQYGSRLDAAFEKHVKSLGVSKSAYLSTAVRGKRIAALISGGKDSLYALYLLGKFGYDPRCMISIISDNEDSYMYHTPTSQLIPHIASRLGLDVVLERTRGEKEHELEALRSALVRATAEHGIVGIGSGAIKSNYQRDRLLLLCEETGLSLHSPLWQFDELTYARQLEENGFSVIVTRVAADGLSDRDVGRAFSYEWAKWLHSRGISPVGEGGEFETLVVDCPLYDRPLAVRLEGVVRDGMSVTGRFVPSPKDL
ncbi:MAG: diphthine--ammonia ligase [Candidatus Woesearchaeota archaeon]